MEKLLRSSHGGTRNIVKGRDGMNGASSGRRLLISSPSPSQQPGECFPLIYQTCPFPLASLIPLL